MGNEKNKGSAAGAAPFAPVRMPSPATRYVEGYRFGASGVYAAQATHLPYSVDDYERGQRAGNVARCYGVSLG